MKKRINLKAFVAFGVAGRALLGALKEKQVAGRRGKRRSQNEDGGGCKKILQRLK